MPKQTPPLTEPRAISDSSPRAGGKKVELFTAAARVAEEYLLGATQRGVAPTAEAVARLDELRQPLPLKGRAPNEVLAELSRIGSPATMLTTHGRYFGFVTGGTDVAARAAGVLVGVWDQNVALPSMSPIAATLDEVAAQWVVEALGLPRQAVASFCSGATFANFTGILVARDAVLSRLGWNVREQGLAGSPPLRVIVGDEVHVSVLRALRLAGFGTNSLERVPTDECGRIRAEAFPRDTGENTLVLLQAGNVNTGHSDPFEEIIPHVRQRGGWVHVDGAFGLWAAASDRKKALVAGAELADSWGLDGHKWLNVGYDCGIAIVREDEALAQTLSTQACVPADDGASPSDANWNPNVPACPRCRGLGNALLSRAQRACRAH